MRINVILKKKNYHLHNTIFYLVIYKAIKSKDYYNQWQFTVYQII